MNTRKYYSLRDLSQELNIPKSTIVKYKDYFPEFFTLHGDGKRKKFQEDALDILRTVRELREEKNLDWMEIRDMLNLRFEEKIAEPMALVEAPRPAPPAPAPASTARFDHLAHLFNAIAFEVMNLAGQTRALQQQQFSQAGNLARVEKSIDRLSHDVELVLLDLIRRDEASVQMHKTGAVEIKAQFASIQKTILTLSTALKSSAQPGATAAASNAESIRLIAEKIDRMAQQTDAGQGKLQALARENKLLKEKIREMEQPVRLEPERKPKKSFFSLSRK